MPVLIFQNCGSSDLFKSSDAASSSAQLEATVFRNMGGEPYQGGGDFFPDSARVADCTASAPSPITSVAIYFTDRYFLVYRFADSLLSPPSPKRTLSYASIDSVEVNGRAADNLVVIGFETTPTRDQLSFRLIYNGIAASTVLSCSR